MSNPNAVATATPAKWLDTYKNQVQSVLTKSLPLARFLRITAAAMSRNPNLILAMQQAPDTLLKAVTDAAALGLELDGRRAHLVPFANRQANRMEVQLIVDYKGIAELIRRSGDVSFIHADVVCENDHFEYAYGTDAKLVHRPCLQGRGNPIACYSYCKFRDGSEDYLVMGIEEVDEIRKTSKGGFDRQSGKFTGIHAAWPDEMRKKTVFRRHAKWLPWSAEVREALDKADAADADAAVVVIGEAYTPTSESSAPVAPVTIDQPPPAAQQERPKRAYNRRQTVQSDPEPTQQAPAESDHEPEPTQGPVPDPTPDPTPEPAQAPTEGSKRANDVLSRAKADGISPQQLMKAINSMWMDDVAGMSLVDVMEQRPNIYNALTKGWPSFVSFIRQEEEAQPQG
jgi:recombination protein RecT